MIRKNEPFWFNGGPVPVKLAYCHNPKAWEMAITQSGLKPANEPWPESAGHCSIISSPKWPEITCIIALNLEGRNVDDGQIVGLLAHEATHVLQAVHKHMNTIQHPEAFNEYDAYVVQWVTQSVFDARKICTKNNARKRN